MKKVLLAEEAAAVREAGEAGMMLFGLCGHGHFDISASDACLAGRLEDLELPRSRIDAAVQDLPKAPVG